MQHHKLQLHDVEYILRSFGLLGDNAESVLSAIDRAFTRSTRAEAIKDVAFAFDCEGLHIIEATRFACTVVGEYWMDL
jgi:hypothetical protein